MKVLQINANYGFGSTGLIVKDIGDIIEASGNEAYFAYQQTSQKMNNGFVIGNSFDWKLHALACRILGGQGYYSILATLKAIKIIKKISPDIVHLHNLHSNYININILFRFLAKNDIATVITMHDCWFFTGKCFHYVDCNCDKFTKACGNCPKKSAPPRSYLFDWSSFSLKNKKKRLLAIPRLTVVGCSDWICDEAKKSILSGCNIERVYNGVDTNVFKPMNINGNEYGISNEEFVVMGMANKWLQGENIDMLSIVSAINGVRLMIVGCTEEQKKQIAEINSSIIAVGFIKEREELAKHYNIADVFVNLTHADTLPTVNMESICCGTTVITYDSCGSPELVNKETGIVVEEGNKDDVVAAILDMKNKSLDDCSQIGSCKYDKNVCYREYLRVYKNLVK